MNLLEKVRGVFVAIQTSMKILLTKIATLIAAAYADWCIRAFKIQTKICTDRRQVKMESF